MTSSSKSTAPNESAIPVVRDIFGVSAEFLGQFRTWLEQNPPAIPVTQIIGFSQFTAQNASVLTQETTTSTSFADLATVGPTLSSLPDGQYLFFFGCVAFNSAAGNQLTMSIDVNSAGASSSDQTAADGPAASYKVNLVRVAAKTLSGAGNNTVTCKYRVSAGTGTFLNRWLIAIRFSN